MRPLLLAALLLAAPAAANDDVQLWTTALAQGPVAGNLVLWLEGQPRFTDDAGRLGQLIIRPGVGLKLAPDTFVHAGYHFQRNTPLGGTATSEHRFWQQAVVPLVRNDRLLLLTRTRLEQRTFEGAEDLGWRLRVQARAQFNPRGTLRPVISSETFVALNSTDWGARAGFDQQRTFAGLGVAIGPRLLLEGGYMNQLIARPGPDRMNHVANVTLFIRLGK